MAIGGTPVGNMIIKVDLDSTGVEKSMTGLQRQLKSSNKSMGAQLSAFGRGEKSADKYGVVIDGLSNRHRIQGRMVTEARANYDNLSNTYGENSVKAQEASQKLNEQISLYQQTGRELDGMTGEFDEFQRVQEIQSKGWYKAADGMENWGGKLKTAGRSMDNTGKKMTKGVTVPLAIVGGLAVKTGSDFEAGMSKVGAVSGATSEEMEELEAKAREMGKTTVFSATDASDAFYYMSLAGWDANESMDGIAGVMDLAGASGEDLASVSDIVTDSLTAFGLEAKDSGRMADVLASASANANTDVSGLGKAFSYVAPVAGALGYTMEDTSVAIGLMSNAGIKSQKAGTALRSMMTSLSKPTAEAQEAMDKYGISLTDSEGEMKSFDEVMLDLRDGVGDLSEEQQAQAASTLFGKEAMSGALAIVNASEEDYDKLTGAIKDSDGAAAEMAETMQDNLQGSLKELKSMVEDLFIEMYQNLKPALEGVIDSTKNLTQWFSDLSPKTQENIVKFGLLAAAIGPVLSVTGKLAFGIGGLMQGAGGLAKVIGLSKGAGLLGAMGALGPLAIGGIAVAGLAAVGTAIYKNKNKTEELEEVNLDLVNSLSEQADGLENSANTFDKLSDKAKISNNELAELNDLNHRISESSNPAVIDELQGQYDKLAKKSGLSKDEIKNLLEANEHMIEQSPNVVSSVSDQGNEFVKSTEAVHDYVQELLEMSRQELSDEILIAQENKTALLKEQKEIQGEINDLNDTSLQLSYLEGLSEKDREKTLQHMLTENKQGQADKRNSQEEINTLKDEEEIINAYLNDGLASGLEVIKEQREVLKEKANLNEEELAKIAALDDEMASIILKQVGINEEGNKGLETLDKKIVKNQEELVELEKQKDTKEGLNEKEKEQYETLTEKVSKQVEAKEFLIDELGIYRDLNSLAEHGLDTANKEVTKKIESLAKSADIKVEEGNIVKQLEKKNDKHDGAISKLKEEKKQNGANKNEINKQISSLKTKKGENSAIIKKVLSELGLWDDVDSSIKDGINSEIKKGGAVDKTKSKLGTQGNQIDTNNSKTDEGTAKERERSAEAGKDVNKDVDVSDNGTVAFLNKIATAPKDKKVSAVDSSGTINRYNRLVTESKTKTVTAKDTTGSISSLNRSASSPVTKVVNLVSRGLGHLLGYAAGTPPEGHPGGAAVIGEEGRELVHLPNGNSFLSPDSHTMLDLPKGTHVIPNRQTERMMKSTPQYAEGTSGWGDLFNFDNIKNNELMKLLALNNSSSKSEVVITQDNNNKSKKNDGLMRLLVEQNSHLKESNDLLTQLLNKDTTIELDGNKVGQGVANTVTKRQSSTTDYNLAKRGIRTVNT